VSECMIGRIGQTLS